MANRSGASPHHKMSQLNLQQKNRARSLVALVPKPSARSDLDDSESSGDELQNYVPPTKSDSSSLPPSLPSSLENLHIMSDTSENEMTEVINTCTTLQPFQLSSPSSICSPSIPSPMPPLFSPLSNTAPVSPLASTPRAILAPTSHCAPIPSTSTRSKRVRTVVVKKKLVKPKRLEITWRYQKFKGLAEVHDVDFPKDCMSPIEYFKLFFSDEIISMIVLQTNLYSTQTKGTSINVTEGDIKDFLAINILMGIVKMPAYTDYWSKNFRFEGISDIMTLKKFQLIRRYLHFNDNLHDDGDRYYKIRPLIQKVRENCLKIPEETRFSVDEMMVPYKGTRAGSRKQYVQNKPKKWGFKIFVRAGISGIVYDFLVYGGEDTFRYRLFSEEEECMGLGAKVVLALAKSIHNPACKILCFDNFFTSIELLQHLRNHYGIFSLGTIRQNRLRGAQEKLPTDKNLKKRGRGSHAQVVCNKNKVVVAKWYDNKCVTVASTYLDSYPLEYVQRYNKDLRRKAPVPCPRMIKEYNSNMGGVDLADMLVALYRIEFRGHRWYLPLFSQILDICINNAWLLYRRNLKDNEPVLKLKLFRYEIYKSILRYERTVSKTKSDLDITSTHLIKKPTAERPLDTVRYDQFGHLPTFTSKGRCRYCTKGQTKFYCTKCETRLCLVEDRNCYMLYHTK